MKRLCTTLLVLLFAVLTASAQTARVQILHNSASPTVDIYANGLLILDNFAYRTATPFLDLPAQALINVAVAPENSNSVADAIATFPVVFESGKTYIVSANGLVGDPLTPFTLLVNEFAKEASDDPAKVDIAVMHGATNAPAVDVDAVFVAGSVISNLSYNEFTPYLSLDPDKYDFSIRPTGSPTSVASFRADLSGLAGQAAYVFASGLLGGDPAFGLFALLPSGQVVQLPATPTARVQVIHNSPSPTVDVYAGSNLIINNFEYRKATPFISLPADRNIPVGIAPDNSLSADDAIAVFPVTFETGKTYAVFASGIVGDTVTPFTLLADLAREASSNPATVEFATLHGATNAPAVDVEVYGVGNIITDLSYGEFAPYLGVAPGNYTLLVKPAGSNDAVAAFQADLSALAGGAARVFASGLLGGDPAFGLFAVLPDGTVVEFPQVAIPGTARLQVVHNSADPTVDIYVNDALFIDDFAYRTATPFVDVPSNVALNIGVALSNSQSSNDVLVNFPVTLETGKTYIATASGIVGDILTPFTLVLNDAGREAAADPGKVDIAVLHGSTNAPAVDVDAVFVADDVIDNLAYGSFTSYLSLDPGVYDFALRAHDDPNVVASYRADLSTLGGAAAWVFASGVLGGEPAFGLFAALPNGAVVELPITPTARVQVIHNSPDPEVDVYAGNTRLINDFAYRTATPFINVPADRNITVGVAGSNSASAADAIASFPVNFASGQTYAVFASGIVGDPTTPFTLLADAARESAGNPANVEFATLHGATDAPAVDVAVLGLGNIITDLSYGEFAPYIGVPPGSYTLLVKPAGSNDVVAAFQADLSTLAGGAARVFASGFLSGTPAFGLFAALPDGTVVEFPQVAIPGTARLQVVHNSADPTVDIYVNDDLFIDDFAYRTATPFVDVPSNVALNIGVALSNSQSSDDVLVSFPVTLETGKTYIATANGIVGSPLTPFTLVLNDAGREAAADPGKVDIAVLHGSTNAPAVDVDAIFVADDVIDNLAYGSFTPYLSLDPGVYDFALRAHNDPNVVASYRADLSVLGGAAAWVFASGELGGTPAFGLFAALPNGLVVELPLTPTARVQIIHNSPSPTVDVYAGNTLLINDFAFRTATPFVTVPANRNITLGIAPDNSNSAADAIATFNANFATGSTYTAIAAGVVGGSPAFNLFVDGNAQETAPSGLTAFSVFHGSPDAPGVDVYERLIGKLIDDITFGEFSPYLSVPPTQYVIDLKVTGSNDIAASFLADLTPLDGIPARVFASGYLGGVPGFGLFAALPDGTVIELPATAVARVQIIHNSPEPTVDVYAFSDLVLDDFAFRQATPYFYVPAGFPISFGVAPGNSQSPSDIIASFDATFENGKTYVVVASGILGDPTTPFTLLVNDNGRERAVDDTKLELSIHHGAPDAPAVNVSPYNSGLTLLSDLQYGDFTPYLTLDPNVYLLEVAPTANPGQLVGIWGGDFTPLPGLVGVVFASGLLNGEPGFDLWLALPDGFTLPLPSFARVQVIHNAPAPTVDAYFDDEIILDDFAFRQATGIGLFPANFDFNLAIAPGNSQSVNDAIYTLPVSNLSTRNVYIIMASGVVGGNPGFELVVNENGRDRAQDPGLVDLTLYHGSPDAPEVDVQVQNGPVIFDNIQYGEFSDYLSVPGDEYVIQVTPANDNNTVVQSYTADISSLTGQAATVFASGYLGGTAPEFEVWVALTNGVTFPLPVFVRTNELDNKLSELTVAPNPASERLTLGFNLNDSEALRYRVRDVAGRLMEEGDFGTLGSGTFAREIEVSYLNPGMYTIEILSDSGLKAIKFAVQR